MARERFSKYWLGSRFFSSASALPFLELPAGLGGAAAAFLAFSASLWRAFWRFFSSVLDTISPVTSSLRRLTVSSTLRSLTCSVGGSEALGSAMIAVCCVTGNLVNRDDSVEKLRFVKGSARGDSNNSPKLFPASRDRDFVKLFTS
ncbi:hypothetical protein LZ32DRAFT_203345 [Colletotrichum eremochloae]|nr:hypothetical protein LZ32DRAFT_203345 [Colletotrichum eremochloae]